MSWIVLRIVLTACIAAIPLGIENQASLEAVPRNRPNLFELSQMIQRAPHLKLRGRDLTIKTPRPGWKLGMVSSIAVDKTGLIYLIQRDEKVDPIVVIDAAGNVVRSWGKGLYVMPHSIRIDPSGNIWTTDAMKSVVYKFSPAGKKLLELHVGQHPEPCEKPCGTTDVAIAPNRHIFVADGYVNARILEYSPDGRFVGEWGKAGSNPGEIHQPHSIAIDEDGILYEADRLNSRVQRFDLKGKFLGEWTNFGKTHALSVHAGEVWLSSQATEKENLEPPGWILKVDKRTGKLLGYTECSGAHGMAVLQNGEVLIRPGENRSHPQWLKSDIGK